MTVTLVIPCYNESMRLIPYRFTSFLETHPEVSFCFVDDGSTDSTAELLSFLSRQSPSISAIFLPRNGGKGAAVQTGLRAVLENGRPDAVGFWDADLATPLEAISDFMAELERSPEIDVVVGSRLARLGADISRSSSRGVVGIAMHALIRKYLGAPVCDTQCGAKIFRSSLARRLFADPFVSRWLFDVELFRRMGSAFVRAHVCELPLRSWHEIGGSKLKSSDALKIVNEMFRIARHYRGSGTLDTPTNQ